ncbi:hypothetical protein ES703_113997 [subsurface metagenome]
MELHNPAGLCVHKGELEHHSGFELEAFGDVQFFAGSDSAEDFFYFFFSVVLGESGFEAVIRKPAAVFVKIIVAFSDCLNVRAEAVYLRIADLLKLIEPFVQSRYVLNCQSFVGAKGGVNLDFKTVVPDFFVVLQ